MKQGQDATEKGPSDRVAHLLAVAADQFLKHGYQNVSVDGIARASGVSKNTIYRHFSDKAEIFRAAIGGVGDMFSHSLPDLTDMSADPEVLLTQCARALYEHGVGGATPGASWITIATAAHFPDVASTVFADGLGRMQPVMDYLARLAAMRGKATDDSIDMLSQFGALAVAGSRFLMGWPPLAERERDLLARHVVLLFLYGCAARDNCPGAPHDAEFDWRIVESDQAEDVPPPGAHIGTLMQVARAQFYERGFRGANLDEIGASARVGRGTLYRHFTNKAGLFRATMIAAARDVAGEGALVLPADRPLSEVLHEAAMRISATLLSNDAIRLYRTVIEEVNSLPEVARKVYLLSRMKIAGPLAAFLKDRMGKGELAPGDPDWLAMQFITLATGGNRYLSADPGPSQADRERIAVKTVSTFLHGYAG